MRTELCDADATAKKSLMNSLARLEDKVIRLKKIDDSSRAILNKLLLSEDLAIKEPIKNEISSRQPDLIDLFNRVDDNLESTMNKIEDILNSIRIMIE